MIYYRNADLTVRSMAERDIEKLVSGFAEQGWNKSYELFEKYYKQQELKVRFVLIAEQCGEVSGYVTLLANAITGPYAKRNIPEIVDFNVLIKYQNKGIGSKLMDVAESLAKEMSDSVSLAVGLHSGYGTAQRMYMKRGYVPDGSGVWYKEQPLEPYTECVNDDDLVLFFLKKLREPG